MTKRTTIEIDDKLLARAKRALGSTTTRGTVEEALRRVADAAEAAGADRAARQRAVLSRLQAHIDGGVLTSEDMWRYRVGARQACRGPGPGPLGRP